MDTVPTAVRTYVLPGQPGQPAILSLLPQPSCQQQQPAASATVMPVVSLHARARGEMRTMFLDTSRSCFPCWLHSSTDCRPGVHTSNKLCGGSFVHCTARTNHNIRNIFHHASLLTTILSVDTGPQLLHAGCMGELGVRDFTVR
ncbi:hypothetical protein C0Q70_13620 [Pomacea canaliculata]|uniref:Uncharacterized protein n=1 Tax=Pomacea canaliculata TaxID=400727 RepID=A0A2T7NXS0_POMCA|nr:hypothetical protein C0Q70_13620 [Pomacea canaliculata]